MEAKSRKRFSMDLNEAEQRIQKRAQDRQAEALAAYKRD